MTRSRKPGALIHKEGIQWRGYLVESKNIRLINQYAFNHDINKSQALNEILREYDLHTTKD